jgi:ribosomal protein S18 acetylase RimI-like enzyme
MSRVTVRRAATADLDLLVPLFEGYRAFYEREPDARAASAFLAQRLERGDSAIFVAVDTATDEGAGFVQLYPVFSSLRMRPAFILNDLFVAPRFRGQHIARQLMNAARAHAVECGAATIALETATDNRAARRLYESLGYRLEDEFKQYVLAL